MQNPGTYDLACVLYQKFSIGGVPYVVANGPIGEDSRMIPEGFWPSQSRGDISGNVVYNGSGGLSYGTLTNAIWGCAE